MSFRYPDFIGPLAEAQLRPGGYAGYSYEYYFEAAGSGAGMGGRSRDFSEGRGRMYTDQPGFGGRSQDEICAVWRAEICRELRPGVLLLGMFPPGQWYCSDAMIHTSSPRVLLAIDLSQHAQIHGFGFTWSLMTPEQEAALQSDWYSGGRLCDPENQATFDAWMAEIRQGVNAASGGVNSNPISGCAIDCAGHAYHSSTHSSFSPTTLNWRTSTVSRGSGRAYCPCAG